MASSLASACVPSTFSPSLFGGSVLNVYTHYVTGYNAVALDTVRFIAPTVNVTDATFCNVTIEYTHPGQGDHVFVEMWLPKDWNGRFQALGGGGWRAGRFALTYGMMVGAMADGFASISSDAGVGSGGLSTWALQSPGNANLHKLNNFAQVAMHDQAVIGKQLIKSYYGTGPSFSYMTGCSAGGRMSLAVAQRYPEDFDGISASAPALNNPELAAFLYWPQQVMNELKDYPYPCEVLAITAAAISACDELDGLKDGIISLPDECLMTFDPFSVVGKEIDCPQAGAKVQISKTAAIVVNETWTGMPTKRGRGLLRGLRPGALLTDPTVLSIVGTTCNATGCVGNPSYLGADFIQYYLTKDPELDISSLTRHEFDEYIYQADYLNSIFASLDPDLKPFRDAGGKLISMHGLADELLPDSQTSAYYDEVDKLTGNAHEFYRYFQVPGLGHCGGGKSGQPNHIMQQLVDWVEKGIAPDTTAVKVNVSNTIQDRILCAYPQRTVYVDSCGNPASTECWSCRKSCKK